jgi:type IV pilus assembly protein PilB
VRRTCSKCRQVYDPPRTVRKALERMGYEIPEFFRGVGCRHCRNTGFSGRIGIHELLVLNEEMRDAITSQASLQALEELAQRQGMLSLRHDGFRKVREGITTIEEVFHVAGEGNESGS